MSPFASSIRALQILWLVALAWLVACPAEPPRWPEHDDGFEDHTVGAIESLAAFEALAAGEPGETVALKFVILEFGAPERQTIRYLDGRFYALHDEWYWFRLLNGQRVPGSRERPVTGHGFATVGEIVDWARARAEPLPLGLQILDERLYSELFYELGVRREHRSFGIGTLLHMPARTGEHPRDELWAFELEYTDSLDVGELELFFAALATTLPAEITDTLNFVARSPDQARLVARLRANDHPLAGRLTSYRELAIPGEVEVYNPGLIAGRLRKLPEDPKRAAALLTTGDPGAIWMVAAVPDELPSAAGLLTAVPQTPLAHVNLLARNRGIPNAYLGGLFDDLQLDQLARVHAPVIVYASAAGELRIEPISEDAYGRWLALRRGQRPVLERLDPATLPYTLDLEREPVERVPELRRIVGGKAAGFPILRAAGATVPERALAITTRAYAEHLDELRPAIADALDRPEVRRDARARYLLLEGREDFDERFASASDQAWVEAFVAAHPERSSKRDPIASLLARGGIRRAIRDRELGPAAASAIADALRAQFGSFAATQGLRFRSSSTVEDVEGFSGAGLYDSNTGFLDPAASADAGEHKKSVAWALRKTWASYWSFEAFEERRMAGIDHLAGDMAVLVHARFDDPLERSNGVLTLTLDVSGDRPGARQRELGPRASMEVDVQLGALSVTNPPVDRAGEVLPEVDRVTLREASGAIAIERVARSTERGPGDDPILDDAALEQLLQRAAAIAERWLAIENRGVDPGRTRSRVTLDLEFREVAAGWPAYASGGPAPARMVIKQVRSLDPGLPPGAEALLDQPIPRELLLHADRIERRSCAGRRGRVDLIEVYTDPMVEPELGHGRVPFLARVRVVARGLEGGPRRFELDHGDLHTVDRHQMAAGGPWALELGIDPTIVPAVGVDLERIELVGGRLRLLLAGKVLLEEPAPCTAELALASPEQFLRALIGM